MDPNLWCVACARNRRRNNKESTTSSSTITHQTTLQDAREKPREHSKRSHDKDALCMGVLKNMCVESCAGSVSVCVRDCVCVCAPECAGTGACHCCDGGDSWQPIVSGCSPSGQHVPARAQMRTATKSTRVACTIVFWSPTTCKHMLVSHHDIWIMITLRRTMNGQIPSGIMSLLT